MDKATAELVAEQVRQIVVGVKPIDGQPGDYAVVLRHDEYAQTIFWTPEAFTSWAADAWPAEGEEGL